jgi:hypothetical protein
VARARGDIHPFSGRAASVSIASVSMRAMTSIATSVGVTAAPPSRTAAAATLATGPTAAS